MTWLTASTMIGDVLGRPLIEHQQQPPEPKTTASTASWPVRIRVAALLRRHSQPSCARAHTPAPSIDGAHALSVSTRGRARQRMEW